MRYDIKSWDDLLYASENCDEQDRLVFYVGTQMIRTRVEFNERVSIDTIIPDDPGIQAQEQLKRSIGEFGMRRLDPDEPGMEYDAARDVWVEVPCVLAVYQLVEMCMAHGIAVNEEEGELRKRLLGFARDVERAVISELRRHYALKAKAVEAR